MAGHHVGGLGEFTLIDRIVARLGDAAAHDLVVPPGDDAAAWRTGPGLTVATIDALVEGTHWRADTMAYGDVGWRAVTANVSDLAAMGADPQYLLIATTFGPAFTVDDLDALIEGIAESCRFHGVRVAGGDVVRGPATSISIAAYGRIEGGRADAPLLRRSRARVGDFVSVSGTPGASAAGLALIEAGRAAEVGVEMLLLAHRRPVARVALGQAAAASGLRCAMDVSDGLLQDIGHIAAASEVGIELAAATLPLHPAAVAALGARVALDLALGGGEDFELVLTGPRDALVRLDTPEVPVTLIGRVVPDHPGEVIVWGEGGEVYEPPRRGWDQTRDSGERRT
ncbi:MAG: thiamine-phosphate kinase [Phycisphaerales bacterium]|nr:MAG: thiamine-phosphate kinase [Phycisphaerales bacterium]